MLRSLDGHGERNGVYSNGERYGFRFQREEDYAYKSLDKVATNLYLARRENRRWGMVDSLNQIRIPFEFAIIKRYVHGDFFMATWEGKMGVLTSGLQPRYDFLYEDLQCFKADHCLAQKDGLWGVVSSGDEVVVPFKYLDVSFGPGIGYRIKAESGWGTVDSAGTSVIPTQYTSIPRTQLKGYQLAINGDQFDLYETSTGKVIPLAIDEAIINHNTWSGIVRKGEFFGVVAAGNLQPDLSYDEVKRLGYGQTSEDMLYSVAKDGQYGVYSTASGLMTSVEFAGLEYHSYAGNKARVLLWKEGSWTMIDATGTAVIPLSPNRLYKLLTGNWVQENNQGQAIKILGMNGELILDGPFSQVKVNSSVGKILQVKDDQGWHLYDVSLNTYLSQNGREVKFLQDGFLATRSTEGWRVVSMGTASSPSPAHEEIWSLWDNNSPQRHHRWPLFRSISRSYSSDGRLEAQFGLVDGEGQQILPNDYDRITLKFDSTLTVVKDRVGQKFDLRTMRLRESTFSAAGYKVSRKPSTTASPMAVGPEQGVPPEIGATAKIRLTPMHFTATGWKLVSPISNQVQLPDGITAINTQMRKVMNSGALYAIWRGDKIGAMDRDGHIVIPAVYDDLAIANQSRGSGLYFSYAKKQGKYGLVNQRGKQVTPCKYDEIRAFQEGLARVRIGEKWGFITIEGEEAIPLIYDSVLPFEFGVSEVIKDDKRMFVDKENNCDWGCD